MKLTKYDKASLVSRQCVSTYKDFRHDSIEARKFLEGIVAAEGIFRVPVTYSGLISKAALAEKAKNPKYIPTKEHYFGRKASADLIFAQLEKGKGYSRVYNIVLSRSRVHLTTSEENIKLKALSHLPWREAYAAAGVELVPYIKTKAILIGDVTYKSASEVAKKFDISTQTVYNRVNGKSKKWSDWSYA